MTTKTYAIIDDMTTARALYDVTPCRSTNEADAIREARREWERLSAHDQKRRDAFCLGVFDAADDCFCGDHDVIIRFI